MNRSSLVFKSIEVRRFRGFQEREHEFKLPSDTFSAGLNIIHGPNASGKTTAALAMQELIWPDTHAKSRLSLTGRYNIGADEWQLEIDSGNLVWQHLNGSRERPEIPAGPMRKSYHLALHELLKADDHDLARLIQNEINGGLDIQAAGDNLGFSDRIPKNTVGQCRRLQATKAAVARLQKAQHSLVVQSEELERLRVEKENASQARDMGALLGTLAKFATAESAAQAAMADLQEFDPLMDRLDGREQTELEETKKKREQKEAELRQQQRDFNDAERESREAGFADSGPASAELLAQLRSLATALADCERDLIAQQKECADWDEKERLARQTL